ncbi:MAG: glycerate-2-kinase family protein [Proteobacteria bacterium]|nr:glycerate-2-kinase family protein [Pseudomonadota bacterium]
MTVSAPAELLRDLFDAALAAADPALAVPRHLPARPEGRTVVIGAGKAAAAMARAVEDHWSGPLEGLVVTRYGHGVPGRQVEGRQVEVVEAAHPVPDAAGRQAAERILALVRGLTADDLVICLISGGGSALLTLPAPGLTLADKQEVNRALLRSGADITQMNCVRKHLSAIKGGRLAAAAAPARVVTLIISDVPGDDPASIASGPTVPDPTSFADARAILARYRAGREHTAHDDARFRSVGALPELDREARDELNGLGYADSGGEPRPHSSGQITIDAGTYRGPGPGSQVHLGAHLGHPGQQRGQFGVRPGL